MMYNICIYITYNTYTNIYFYVCLIFFNKYIVKSSDAPSIVPRASQTSKKGIEIQSMIEKKHPRRTSHHVCIFCNHTWSAFYKILNHPPHTFRNFLRR